MVKFLLIILFFFPANQCGAKVDPNEIVLGFHVHEPKNIELAAKIGYGAIRLWDTRTDWRSISKEQDHYDFSRIDNYLAESEKLNLKVLWTLGNTPAWASARPAEKCSYGYGCAAEPKNIEDWRAYVSLIATKYRGRVECYEPWNEVSFPNDSAFWVPFSGGANNQFFTGSIKDMVLISKVAYEEIKKADPNACVTSPSFHNSGDMVKKFNEFLAAGGGKYFDVVSQHFYFTNDPDEQSWVIRAIHQLLIKYHLSSKPIWNTEVGSLFYIKSLKNSTMGLQDLVYTTILKTYLLNISEGVNRIYWYAWDNGNYGFLTPENHYDFGSAAANSALELLKDIKSVKCKKIERRMECILIKANMKQKVVWLTGLSPKPEIVNLKANASRWGGVKIEEFKSSDMVLLDSRPVITNQE